MSSGGIIREPGEVFHCAVHDVALVDMHPQGVGWQEPVGDVDRDAVRKHWWNRPRDPHAHPALRTRAMRPVTIMDGTLPNGAL